MSEQAVADEPQKELKEIKADGETYNEKVTVKIYVNRQKEFLKPVPDVWAVRKDTKQKGLMFNVWGAVKPGTENAKKPMSLPMSAIEKGSIITDAAGNEYEVIEAEASRSGLFVKLVKAAPKPQ